MHIKNEEKNSNFSTLFFESKQLLIKIIHEFHPKLDFSMNFSSHHPDSPPFLSLFGDFGTQKFQI